MLTRADATTPEQLVAFLSQQRDLGQILRDLIALAPAVDTPALQALLEATVGDAEQAAAPLVGHG